MSRAAVLFAAVLASFLISIARAQVDIETLQEMTKNMAVCGQQQAAECEAVCKTAYRSFSEAPPSGDQAAIAQCRALSGPVRAAMEAQEAAAATLAEAKKEARELLNSCRGDNRMDCMAACRAAYEAPGDATQLGACQAAQPAPIIDPNAGLTFADRLALRDDYVAYCEAKIASGQITRGDRRPLEGCITMCRNTHMTNPAVPTEQQEAYLAQCETSYRMLKAHFGD